ncbi:MAG: Fe-S protein assembly co-chaperone HscB, partial [Myxococcales bacterium]
MRCWSCASDTGEGPLCQGCGAVQPLPPGASLFRVLGLQESWFLEARAVEERFRELNRRLHPDKFAQKSPRERRMSLEWTTQVNDAYRTLKDPLRRAMYLLKLQGLEVEKETGGSAMQQVPPEFLEQVMELREGLMDAKLERDLDKVRVMAKDVRARKAGVEADLAAELGAWERTQARDALERAAQAVAIGRYYERFLEE